MGSLPNLHELGLNNNNNNNNNNNQQIISGNCHFNHPTITTVSCKNAKKISITRSNGLETKIIFDDFMLEHMASYSPISLNTTTTLTTTKQQQQQLNRRSSLTSSVGSTSVRRLIGIVKTTSINQTNCNQHNNNQQNNSTSLRYNTLYTRKLLLRNLLILCLTHCMITATLLPFLSLQSSISIWTIPLLNNLIPLNVYIGSLLMSLIYLIASLTTFIGSAIIQKFGANIILSISCLILSIYYLIHLYPTFYLLLPLTFIIGFIISLIELSQLTFLMILSTKITYYYIDDYNDDNNYLKYYRKSCILRRLARAFQASHDFGLIIGSLLTTFLINYTINYNGTMDRWQNNTMGYTENSFYNDIFDSDDEGNRLCGAQACPPPSKHYNNTILLDLNLLLPSTTTTILVILFAIISLLAAFVSAIGMDKIRIFIYQDPLERPISLAVIQNVWNSFKDGRLQMAAPLALFIGFEQAFMYADFSKSYVVCTLGIHRLNSVFLSMGLLQSIAACTLSMLLRSIRRYYVIGVGFSFQCCLLLVLFLWKPIEDDPALFYVISASWGVCNAIWEILNFTLLTGLYGDNWETAFANSYFFRFLGMSLAFTSHGVVCNYIKLYSLTILLILSVIPFLWLEIRLENIRKVKNITKL